VGDLHGVATTLTNLGGLYAELCQLAKAREVLREAERIGLDLNDELLVHKARHNLRHVDEVGREAGKTGRIVGPTVPCACESGKPYAECCGRADHEPWDFNIEFGGMSEEMQEVNADISAAGGLPSRLDYILREPKEGLHRFSWTRTHVRDGWLEMGQLPDMASQHLAAAREMAQLADATPDSPHAPSAAVMLSICAAEAFINQVAFFLHDIQSFPDSVLHVIPDEVKSGAADFQRHTELSSKWEILGKALCGKRWPPDAWDDFRTLLYVRNELVHFKAYEYEPVIPPPAKRHPVIARLPATITVRAIPQAWPQRVLTPSLGVWAVNVVSSMISDFRAGYKAERVASTA
jgi:hypothetical protein